ncbi:MAG: alpha/beta hydrolase [Gemmatimonadaceae bacterium]
MTGGGEVINATDPHGGQPVRHLGPPLPQAKAAMIMVHGRGASAESILTLVAGLSHPDITFLAPQAAGNTWYPNSFLAPIESNEPGITSGLNAIGAVLSDIIGAGVPAVRTALLGFSQGACLSLEFAARNARRYGGVACLSGGLIGPDGTPRHYEGSFDGTPIFLGCSEIDPHIPAARVRHSAEVLRGMSADVTMRLYPGMGHTVNEEELELVRSMLADLVALP